MKRKFILHFGVAMCAVLAAAGWSAAVATGTDAGIAKTSLGTIVVDGKGMTAYFFDRDTANSGASSCTGGCAAAWPAITSASATPSVSGITGTVGIIAATKQITINGRPIYTYAFDTAPGMTKGQGVGEVWYVLSASGEEMKSAKPVESAKPTPSLAPTKSPKPVKSTVKAAKKTKPAKSTKSPKPIPSFKSHY